MADCTYSRCIQQRRNIKRDLQRWTKNMVYIVGLERIAEELMGRRKWKLYQDSMQRNYLQPLDHNIKALAHYHDQSPLTLETGHTTVNTSNSKHHQHPEDTIVEVENHRASSPGSATSPGGRPTTVGTVTRGEAEGGEAAVVGAIEGGNCSGAVAPSGQQQQQEEEEEEEEEDRGGVEQRLSPSRVRDWSPPSKCHFCVDGKLDGEIANHGGLSPHGNHHLHHHHHHHHTSDDSDDCTSNDDSNAPSEGESSSPPSLLLLAAPGRRPLRHRRALRRRLRSNSASAAANHSSGGKQLLSQQLVQQQHHQLPLNMTTIDGMTLAAMAAMTSGGGGGGGGSGGGASASPTNSQAAVAAAAAAAGFPFYPGAPSLPAASSLQQQHNLFQIANAMRSAAAAAAAASAAAPGSDPDRSAGTGEQPLDLSARPTATNSTERGPNNIRLAALDTRHVLNSDFRARPRMPTVAGRRTYTEEELQAALRDIQSGKLGTRRAAVIYGIPRSTLRNKVYKLALERERETHLNTSPSAASAAAAAADDEDVIMDDDKELSGAEEEKEVEKALQAPLLSLADFMRCSETNTPDALKTLLLRNKELSGEYAEPPSPINPYLHSFLLNSGGLMAQKFDGEMNPVLPELIKRMFEDQMKAHHHQQQQQQQQQQHHNNGDSEKLIRPSPSNSVIMRNATRSESDMETEESGSNVILKIPSYKPTGNKNGDVGGVYHRSSLDSSGSMVSPPVTSDSGSPPILLPSSKSALHHPLKDVKDVIAASISKKFQQQSEQDSRPVLMRHNISHTDVLDFKRTGGFTPPLGGISVIKTQELTRAYAPQQSQHTPQNKPLQHTQHSSSSNVNSSNASSSSGGGKGTRPKRGKYRNYDRDSLVEAVRAVQRGEMSVHRAGSYYGVPHSTLEYKVKERHLMRPRKRDPKPNPVDEKIAALKQNDLRPQDKLKVVAGGMTMKQPQKFPPNSPNGIKLPLFDPAMAPMGFNPAPFPFWAPSFHSHIPLDFNPNQNPVTFPNNSTADQQQQFLASQVIQKLHEESRRNSTTSSVGNHPTTSAGVGTIPALPKSHRHIAESLLDGCTANGSFLDGIIRSSLESGVPLNDKILIEERNSIAPENLSNKALLEQLMCRNSRLKSSMSETSSGDEAGSYRKDATSPVNENSMEHDHESINHESVNQNLMHTIELSNDSQDRRNDDDDDEDADDQRNEVILNAPAPVQGRIYVKHDLMSASSDVGLLRFREVGLPNALGHLDTVGAIEMNGTLNERDSVGAVLGNNASADAQAIVD